MALKAAAKKCARCGAIDHATSECGYSFHRVTCAKCNKVCREVKPEAPMCIVVKAQREADWKAGQAAYEVRQEEKKSKKEMQKALRQLQHKTRLGSDDISDGASTCAETVSLADVPRLVEEYDARQSLRHDEILQNANGRLCLSEADEREARKIEKKLRVIASLQEKLNQGHALDKLQLEKIRSKDSLESSSVMLKIRAGAPRLALAPAPAPAACEA